jgi:phosphate transport system substrate-binding protein
MLSRKKLAVAVLAVSALIVSSSPAFAAQLNASGATFATPLIDACKVDFNKDTTHTINYTGGGSGKGRTDFASGLVDFAGSDAAYTVGEPTNLVYAPIYAAPIAIMYNLPSVKESIYLTPRTVAKIFSGYIENWNDPIIAADNERTIKSPVFATKTVTVKDKNKKNVKKTVPVLDKAGKPVVASYVSKTVNIDLPNQPITVYYRSESSGTSENFTKWLKGTNLANADWPKAGNGTFANATPTGITSFFNFQGASGSAAVAAGVAGKVGAITYSELSFATDNKLAIANIQNAAGEFVAPSAAGTSAFLGGGTIGANGVVTPDYVKSLPGAYPLGTTSYGLAYSAGAGKDAATQKLIADWFTYVLDKCPSKYPEKGFAQITGPMYDKAKSQIALIK